MAPTTRVRSDISSVIGPILMIFGYTMYIHGTPGPFWNWGKKFNITPRKGAITPQMAPTTRVRSDISSVTWPILMIFGYVMYIPGTPGPF